MKVLVIGAGAMGHAIAELTAIYGHEVYLVDIKQEILDQAISNIKWSLEQLKNKGTIQSGEEILNRIHVTTDLSSVAAEADLVIEAISENLELKAKLFETLDKLCKEEVIIASNTSSIPISKLALATKRPEKVAGLHFFNPPLLIRFVEIIGHTNVARTTIERLIEFAKSLAMDYVVLQKDIPGFVVNRLAIRGFLEAMKLVEKGFTYEEIDTFAKKRLGYPMGIFELADFVGIDILYSVLKEMAAAGVKVNIPKLLEEMVSSKRLGIKTGAGFYEYGFKLASKNIRNERIYEISTVRFLASTINECAWLISNNVCEAKDIDKAMKKGLNLPKGPLEFADEIGIDKVVSTLKEMGGEGEYFPNELLLDMLSKNRLGKKSGQGFYSWKYERYELGNILYEKRHDYAMITMRRERKLNSLDEEMWKNLNEAFTIAAKDKEIRAIVITGQGRAFSAGDDISVMEKWKSLNEGKEFFERTIAPFVLNLLNYEKPVISLISGIAYGGGLEINLLFDIVIASDDASFALPEGLIGAMPPIGSTVGVAMLGRKLLRYCLTGEQFDAFEAKELGLVDIVVRKDQLDEIMVEFLDKIRRVAPLSEKAIKRSVSALRNLYLNALLIGTEELSSLVATEDFKEGMSAFMSKRYPIWKGQ
ncbi:MAG TPA: 3-hydroxyacyl-CoA dehydrogenase/enoyl-CoA hydratase family protein [Geobacterales bacterium]|nr:3-hydroxyacyl-CoA dehydrogenase/enoyl-CoA hydratase family protein [Geobacterales bacterium]